MPRIRVSAPASNRYLPQCEPFAIGTFPILHYFRPIIVNLDGGLFRRPRCAVHSGRRADCGASCRCFCWSPGDGRSRQACLPPNIEGIRSVVLKVAVLTPAGVSSGRSDRHNRPGWIVWRHYLQRRPGSAIIGHMGTLLCETDEITLQTFNTV